VQSSKVEKPKSRTVTAKQRKATEKIVKQDVKEKKEGKKGKVAEAVAMIEERLQGDGTPPRRSARIRLKRKRLSGSPVP
jgi:hypothetical protein